MCSMLIFPSSIIVTIQIFQLNNARGGEDYQTDCHYETLIARPSCAPINPSQARDYIPLDEGISNQNLGSNVNPDNTSGEKN